MMLNKNKSIILPRDVVSLLEKLENNGFEAYAVGGAVRDSILGRTVNDYDITTSATPEETIKVFDGYKIILTGLQHGTITVMTGSEGREITTFRTDGNYTDGRHPDSVSFVRNLSEDLARRDFTINALACDKNGNVIDYYGGLEDLKNKVVKCVGEPTHRFQEDSLRILRALRFSAQLGFSIEKETSRAMKELKETLNRVSRERVRVEFNKMMGSSDSQHLSYLLKEYKDIMSTFIPEIIPCMEPIKEISYHNSEIYEHLCNVVKNIETPDYILRIAAYFHDIGKPSTFAYDENKKKITFYNHDIKGAEIAYNILRRLKYSKEEIEEIILLIRYHNDPTKVNTKWVKRKLTKFNGNEQRLRKLFILKLADVRDHKFFKVWQYSKFNQLNDILDQILDEDQCFTLKKLKVNGYDMMQIGLQGEAIGKALNLLLKAVIDEQVENDHDILMEFIKKKKI